MSIPGGPLAPTPTARLMGGLVLRPVPEAVGVGRAELAALLATLYPEFDSADCVLMLSELVTNAIEHVRVEFDWLINVMCWSDGDAMRVEVHDAGRGTPRMRKADSEACDGRGLFLIDMLSDDWGSGRNAWGGTVAWFAVRMP